MKTLAFYIYPLPNGTEYTSDDLTDRDNVLRLFDYCQILEAVIYRSGWDFLIKHYGYESLYDINKESDWLDCNSVGEFVRCVEYQKEISD